VSRLSDAEGLTLTGGFDSGLFSLLGEATRLEPGNRAESSPAFTPHCAIRSLSAPPAELRNLNERGFAVAQVTTIAAAN
jgi:hypothetical protein